MVNETKVSGGTQGIATILSSFAAFVFTSLLFLLGVIIVAPAAAALLDSYWGTVASPQQAASMSFGSIPSLLRAVIVLGFSTYAALRLSGALFVRANMSSVALAFSIFAGIWGILSAAGVYLSAGAFAAFGVALIAAAVVGTALIHGRLQP